jgi:hypothetical protein
MKKLAKSCKTHVVPNKITVDNMDNEINYKKATIHVPRIHARHLGTEIHIMKRAGTIQISDTGESEK